MHLLTENTSSRTCLDLLRKVVLKIPFSSHHTLIVFPLARDPRYTSAHVSDLSRF